ncbi:MAG: class I SAM-dependent methyltransferase [Promethearchaeota archaeon]
MDQNKNTKWQDSWDNYESDLVVNYDFLHNIAIPKRAENLTLFQDYSEFIPNRKKRFLDLGAGTGAAAFSVLQKYSDAKAILIDGSKPMLEQAQKEADIKGYSIKTIYQDLSKRDWIKKCDLKSEFPLIISSFMIHHLTDKEKARFFKDLYHLLVPSGRFLYADVVKMETKEQEDTCFDFWINEIIKNKIANRIKPRSFDIEKNSLIIDMEKQGDMPATISFILKSLKNAGFKKSIMIWFYLKFAMFLAIK